MLNHVLDGQPWPIIATFISSLPTGWVGLDSGTGNGKYLSLPLDRPSAICTIGLDRSRNLLTIAKTAGDTGVTRDVVLGDVLGRGWRKGVFVRPVFLVIDCAFYFTTGLRNFSRHNTPSRVPRTSKNRRQSRYHGLCSIISLIHPQRLLESVSPRHGRVLIYVWAIDQDELSKRAIPTDGKSTTGQDVVVPWVLSEQGGGGGVFNRYYHMFARGELVGLVHDAVNELGRQLGSPSPSKDSPVSRGVDVVQDGWERSNYYVELRCWELP